MRLIKLAIISFIFLFILVTAIGLLFPSSVIVSRAVDISANKDTVYNKINNVYAWQQWIVGMNKPEVKILSANKIDFFGTSVTITQVTDSTITSNWVGKKGSVQESVIRIIHHNNSPQLVVQWQFTEHLKWYPWQRFGSMLNEAVTGKQLEDNLASLKKLIEQQ
jgi:hypothetical protein